MPEPELHLKLLADLSRVFAEQVEKLDVLLDLVVSKIGETVGDSCAVRLLSDDSRWLTGKHVWHPDAHAREMMAKIVARDIPATEGASGQAIATGKSVLVPRIEPAAVARAFSDPAIRAYVEKNPIYGTIVAPLRARGRVFGVVSVGRHSEGNPYAEADRVLLEEIADRAALAIENARLLRAAEESCEQKDQFIAMLAHELRNPLAGMLNAAYLLSMPGAPEPSLQRARTTIDRQVRHLSRLVDDLLDVSRISRGKIELKRERLDLLSVVRESAEDFTAPFREAGVALLLDLPDSPLMISGDRTRLVQIVSNLLSNVLKFTAKDGRCTVRVTSEGGRHVRVSVADDGLGIEPQLLQSVFEPFVQASVPVAKRAGLGLGLAVVRGLVELHGGTIRAHSAGLGKGTEITFDLPAEVVDDATAKVTILVVEDNEDLALTMKDLLSAGGHRVEIQLTGEGAVERIRELCPDLVLCDIALPGKDGYAIAREVRADPKLSSTRMIAISGYGMTADKERALRSGFNQHLTKPLEPAAISSLVRG